MDVKQQICGMDAVALAKAIRTKELSPVEVVEAHLARMEVLELSIHAFCTITSQAAREQARQVEARILRGDEVGVLAGVPVGIKDLVSTAGIRTVSGSPAYKDFVPDEDDVVVERLKKADAIIVGKTNVPEFGYSGVGHNPVFETTRNHAGRLQRGFRRGGSERRSAFCHWQRWRRIDPHSGSTFGNLRHQGVDGTRAALSRLP
jgi:aspartyl-tRNA(Asn)/glutamyl-tRNA(Gln) amidotransferase subunit A